MTGKWNRLNKEARTWRVLRKPYLQKDCHYYCIGALAWAAGFSRDDALLLAYASQYVDDL